MEGPTSYPQTAPDDGNYSNVGLSQSSLKKSRQREFKAAEGCVLLMAPNPCFEISFLGARIQFPIEALSLEGIKMSDGGEVVKKKIVFIFPVWLHFSS